MPEIVIDEPDDVEPPGETEVRSDTSHAAQESMNAPMLDGGDVEGEFAADDGDSDVAQNESADGERQDANDRGGHQEQVDQDGFEGTAEEDDFDKADSTYSRPSGFRVSVRDQVWYDAIEESTGQARDSVTGRFMSNNNQWDMGHRPGYEFAKHQDSAAARGISRDQFLDEHNTPSHYRPELPSA